MTSKIGVIAKPESAFGTENLRVARRLLHVNATNVQRHVVLLEATILTQIALKVFSFGVDAVDVQRNVTTVFEGFLAKRAAVSICVECSWTVKLIDFF